MPKWPKTLGIIPFSHLGIIKAIVRIPHEPIIIKKCQPRVCTFFFSNVHTEDVIWWIWLTWITVELYLWKSCRMAWWDCEGVRRTFEENQAVKAPEVFSCSSPCLDWKEASDGNIYPDSLFENLMRKSPPFLVEKGNFKTYNVERFRNYFPKQFC